MSDSAALKETPTWIELVRRQVETLQFGVVQIVVHESKVVQIEKTEKVRVADPSIRRSAQ